MIVCRVLKRKKKLDTFSNLRNVFCKKIMFVWCRLNEAMQQRGFKLLEEGEETLMIREHHRKYQFIIPHVSIFQKLE